MISREKFIQAIDVLRVQTHNDRLACESIEHVFPGSQVNVYDNSLLIKMVIRLLREWFPVDKNNFCEIDHYCFDLNFGKYGDSEVITAGDLYDRLVGEKLEKFSGLVSNEPSSFKAKADYLLDEVGKCQKPDSENPYHKHWKLIIKNSPVKGQFILEEEGIVPLEEIAKGLPKFIKTKEIINEAIKRLIP